MVTKMGGALAALTVALTAAAQQYPAKPVRIVVPFAPGGGTDFTARLIAQRLGERMRQAFVVDNRPGAGGNLAAEQLVKSAPDGYTLLVVSASYTVNPSVYKLSFDAVNDITPIVQISSGPLIVAVHPSVPAQTLADFIALAKREPGKLAYGSAGNGSIMHVSSEYLLHSADIRVIHVPYKGTGPALSDTIAGNVQMALGAVAATLPHVKAGRLRALAVTTKQRIAAAPEVPTVAESGYPEYEVATWHGLIGPKGLPKDVVERLNRVVNGSIRSDEMKKQFAADGLEPAGGTPENFAAILKDEAARWAKVVQQARIKID